MYTINCFQSQKYYIVANNSTETMMGPSRTQVSKEYKCSNTSFQISTSIVLLVTLPIITPTSCQWDYWHSDVLSKHCLALPRAQDKSFPLWLMWIMTKNNSSLLNCIPLWNEHYPKEKRRTQQQKEMLSPPLESNDFNC